MVTALLMTKIPLEDNFTDILGKAQRGLGLSDDAVAEKAGIGVTDLHALKQGEVKPEALKKAARALGLGGDALVQSANKSWYPREHSVPGLAAFNTPYEDMTVNAYLVWDSDTGAAAVFDTGASADPALAFARENGLSINLILLTHTHPDHIADLAKLQQATGAPTYVCGLEAISGAESFSAGKVFQLGRLQISTRQTSGHSRGGITFVISGLAQPVAIVGDAIFAGSMGGGGVSYSDALANNRKYILGLEKNTILCPGHGPLTTVGEEQQHNPFYPEFQNSNPN
jgi:glyoxylase-like metal-dependent hydrolase (beta-lactamase superfamily II)